MQRISFLLVLITCLFPTVVATQELAPVELYMGYSYVRAATASQVNAFNNNGGLGSLQYNLNENFAIVAEFGAYMSGNISIKGPELSTLDQRYFSYQFGPRVSLTKRGRYVPFVHYLLGGVHQYRSFVVPNSRIPPNAVVPPGITAKVYAQNTEFRSTQNALAQTLGGGLDINLSRRFAVRPVQVDYLPTLFSPLNVPGIPGTINETTFQHNLRFSAGLTFRLGGEAGPIAH